MIFSRHIYWIILLHVMLILVTSGTGAWLIISQRGFVIGTLLITCSLFQISRLVNKLNSFNQKLRVFFDAIEDKDNMLYFPEQNVSKEQEKLNRSLNRINFLLAKTQSEYSKQEHFYRSLLEEVPSGVLAWDSTGKIIIANSTALSLLDCQQLTRYRQLESLLQEKGKKEHLSLSQSRMKLQDETITLLSIKDIGDELSDKESESWNKLSHVLTHEIMNSIAPIISLSETLSERAVQNGMNERDYNIMLQGMQTIHRRSKGLLNFVENYRKLSRLSVPILAPVNIGDLLSDMKKLFPNKNIQYIYKVENPETTLMLDRSQIEQVLINLLKNAGEACVEQIYPEVIISTHCDLEKHLFFLSVCDNGSGILPEVLDKIFVPFFTTKPTGSGIGLSLCKQIMNLHGGSISASSEIGKGSCFTLKFLCCG